MIQFMPANHSNTNRVITILIHSDKTRFHNVFVTLLCRVAKDVTSSLPSWHKRYDFNATNFRRHSQWKCALQTLWIRIKECTWYSFFSASALLWSRDVHCLSLTFHIFDFSSETAEQNSMKLDRKQDLNVLYQVCIFRADQKVSWQPPIGRDIFDFSSETPEHNSTKLNRKQNLNILYKVSVFRADWKTKMVTLVDPSTKVAHCAQVHHMWPFRPLVSGFMRNESVRNKQITWSAGNLFALHSRFIPTERGRNLSSETGIF